MGQIITVGPNKVAVISGCTGTRMLIGRSGVQLCCCEQTSYMSLELLTMVIESYSAETIRGVRVDCKSVAQIKVKAIKNVERITGRKDDGTKAGVKTEDDDDDDGLSPKEVKMARGNEIQYDLASVKLAATHFLGDTEVRVKESILKTMEGPKKKTN